MVRISGAGRALLVVAAASLGLTLTAHPRAQGGAQQPPVFRSGADTVSIYATVLDRGGFPVLNLQEDDFEVLDNGKRQPLSVFVSGLQPISAAVLVDTSASMTLNLGLAQSAAEGFVIRMLPGDQARVGFFSDRIDLSPGFLSDRDALLGAMRDGLHFGNRTLLFDAIDQALTSMAPLGGRRVVLLFTDGADTLSRTTMDHLLERGRVEEVMLYVVQFRSNARALLAEESLAPTPGEMFDNRRRRQPPATEVLRRLARQTGGGHFLLNQFDDVNATFTQVMQELHYQYVLGFTPQADGRIHEIQVRMKRPGLAVRARQSYKAPENRP
jgi:Ca-activated chloride channel homolog